MPQPASWTNVKDDASLASRLSIVALTPVAAGIIALAGALAVITSNYGNVSLDDTVVLGGTLAALAFGLVPFAVTLVQMRVFYAMKDARTPTIINAIMVAVRVPLLLLCASLDDSLVIPGMAAATSISYLAGAIAGEIWLRARYGPMGTRRTLVTLVKMTVAGAAGAGAALLVSDRLAAARCRWARRRDRRGAGRRDRRAAGDRRTCRAAPGRRTGSGPQSHRRPGEFGHQAILSARRTQPWCVPRRQAHWTWHPRR